MPGALRSSVEAVTAITLAIHDDPKQRDAGRFGVGAGDVSDESEPVM